MNPELRQTIQTFTRNLESANETAQENIYTFSQNYIDPCFGSVKSCFQACTAPCFPSPEEQLRRRKRGTSRGRAEYNFDFYDDWDNDEGGEEEALLGEWSNERLDRLLAGSGESAAGSGEGGRKQPRKQRTMSYGARGTRGRRTTLPQDDGADPTIIPGSAMLGFLERLPFKIGSRALRYKPSAADLQVNPGMNYRSHDDEAQPLVEDSDGGEERHQEARYQPKPVKGRKRSGTNASRSTTNSLSSRGDLIPSDEEADAVPLDDEFANALERKTTGPYTDDRSSGKTGSGKGPSNSRMSTRSVSTKSIHTDRSQRSSSRKKDINLDMPDAQEIEVPSLGDLKQEEEEIRQEEEANLERKRVAAQTLAQDQGLLEDVKEDENMASESTAIVNAPERTEDAANAMTENPAEEEVAEIARAPSPPAQDHPQMTVNTKKDEDVG